VVATCTIVILLPSKPCDLYVEGALIKAGVYDKLEMVTPNLDRGSYKYTLQLKDSSDSTKSKEHVVTGIVAGGKVTVDLRNTEMAAL